MLAEAAAERVTLLAVAAIAARGRCALGLSGGRTPENLYRALARAGAPAGDARSGTGTAAVTRPPLDWSRVRIYFADERAVSPRHTKSNFRLASKTLIDPLHLPPQNVHRMKGEYADLGAAVEEYEAHLTEPLDLLILGIGTDGHTASIFPGSALVEERTHRVAAVLDSPRPPARRLTVTARVIGEARAVLVLATGDSKSRAVAAALEAEGPVREVPARLARGREWYLDRCAAAALSPALRGKQ